MEDSEPLPSIREAGNWPIEQLPGIGSTDLARLHACGIATTWQLRDQGSTPERQQALARCLQLPIRYVQKWVALADLARIPGVGCQYCGLLLHAGILSCADLALSSAQQLHRHLIRLQVSSLRQRHQSPSSAEVASWIRSAQRLTGQPIG
jgi:predicted flap endonuclease-1-like 5' DNA nuclease